MNMGIDIVLLQLVNVIVRVSSFAIAPPFFLVVQACFSQTFMTPQKLSANAPSKINGTKYMYMHTYLYIYTCAYVYMYTCVYIYIYIYM